MIRMTPTSSPTNNADAVGSVPAPGGCRFFFTSDPAMAMIGTIIKKRPINMAKPIEASHQVLTPLKLANADPLLPTAEE